MKVLKKTCIAALAGLVLFACEKEELFQDATSLKAKIEKSEAVKMVPFKGKLSSIPPKDVEPIYFPCYAESGDVEYILLNSVVFGNATHLGKLDLSQSQITTVSCFLDPETMTIGTVLDMTLKNKKGDGLLFRGSVTLSFYGPTEGNFEVVEGYGKFEGATGEITTEGTLDPVAGITVFRAEGMVSQPNH